MTITHKTREPRARKSFAKRIGKDSDRISLSIQVLACMRRMYPRTGPEDQILVEIINGFYDIKYC